MGGPEGQQVLLSSCLEGKEVERSHNQEEEPPRRLAEEWEGEVQAPGEAGRAWQILTTPKKRDFPGGSDGKESAYNAGDPGLIPGSGRSPGEGNDNPLQYSCLENSMDRGAWWATVHGVTKRWTRLSNFTSSRKEGFPGGLSG